MDNSDIPKKKMAEFKTGKVKWTQKRVDELGQIDMYLLMLYITHKIRPEDMTVHLYWLPTKENGDFSISFVEPFRVKSFRTCRTMTQILEFGVFINKIQKEMIDYCEQIGSKGIKNKIVFFL